MRRMRQGGYSWAEIQAPFPIVPKALSKSNTRLKFKKKMVDEFKH